MMYAEFREDLEAAIGMPINWTEQSAFGLAQIWLTLGRLPETCSPVEACSLAARAEGALELMWGFAMLTEAQYHALHRHMGSMLRATILRWPAGGHPPQVTHHLHSHRLPAR